MKKKEKLNFKRTILMIGYIPLLTANIILTLFATNQLKSNLEESTYLRLKACASSVEQYFTWDIREGILCKDEVSYEFIDSLKEEDIELTFFEGDTRYITSITDKKGNRLEDTKADAKIWEIVKSGKDYQADKVKISETEYYVYYMPVRSETGEVIGMAFAGENENTVKEQKNSLLISMYTIDTILLVVFGIILYRVALLIRKPIAEVVDVIDTLANGDLTQEIKVKSILTEMKTLIEAAKTLQSKVGDVVKKVVNNTNVMSETVSELNVLSNSSSTGAQQISTTMEDLSKTTTSLADNVQEVNSKVIDIGNEINEIKDNVGRLNDNSDYMKDANENATKSMKTVLNSSDKSVNAVDYISEQIKNTNDAIKEITDAVTLILDITNQTKLLSLNASIEAARAGEYGRGFAVVASEIKKLSEQSAEGAEKIRSVTDNILNKSGETVELAKNIKEIIKQEQKDIAETQKNFDMLSKFIEQSIEVAEEINSKTVALDTLKESIISNVNDLSAISEENAASTEETSASAICIAESVENITEETSNIKLMSEELTELIKYFSV